MLADSGPLERETERDREGERESAIEGSAIFSVQP